MRAALAHPASWLPWVSISVALLIAAFELTRRQLPGSLVRGLDSVTDPVLKAITQVHSGLVGDYVAWLVLGLALFTIAAAFSWHRRSADPSRLRKP